MARPRLGESETKRLQMVITEDELAAIDEWRFAKHIGSRSEAIRRLCAVALGALNGIDKLKQMAVDASAQALDDYEHIGGLERGFIQDAVEGNEHGLDYEQAKNLLLDLTQRAYWQEQNTRYLNRIIAGLSDTLDTFADPGSFANAEKKAEERFAELNAFVDYQHTTWDYMGAAHARSSIIRSLSAEDRAYLDATEDREERIRFLDEKVTKYQASKNRRHKRLIAKIRKEDERIRRGILERLKTQNEDGMEGDE